MRKVFKKVKKNSDGLFGPTSSNKFYKPVFYHNRTAKSNKHKSKWVVKQNEQYCIFELSDVNKWKCKLKDGYFSIIDNGKVILGSNEEILSFFPETKNSNDPYHGYPVSSADYEMSPSFIRQVVKR